jgi:hypothetical protein
MKLQITGCINCPFTYVQGTSMGCRIGYKDDTKLTFRRFSDSEQKIFKTSFESQKSHIIFIASWCPFYEEESIIVELDPITTAAIKEEKEPEKTLWDHLVMEKT